MASEPAEVEQMLDVSILVVGYNSLAFLPDALGSLAEAAQQCSYEVLFVNNGTDGSEARVAAEFPAVQIMPSRGNIGFAAANNYLATEARGNWLLLLNPDTECEAGAVDALLRAAKDYPEFGVLGGISTDAAGLAHPMSALSFPSIGHIVRGMLGLKPRRLDPPDSRMPVSVDAVSGGFMLVLGDLWGSLGGLDERFFLYAEELDFCFRYHAEGGKVGLVSEARIMHDVGSGNAKSAQRLLFSMRGIASFYHKHFGRSYAVSCLALHWLSCALRLGAWCAASPFVAKHRQYARAIMPIVLCPWSWMGGWAERAMPKKGLDD